MNFFVLTFRGLLVLLFLCSINHVRGEESWVLIGEFVIGSKDYLSLNSIGKRRCGLSLEFRCKKFLEMRDLTETGSEGQMSIKNMVEYDCKKKKWKTIFSVLYPENLGFGEPLMKKEGSNKWKKIEMGSPEEKKYELICQKRLS